MGFRARLLFISVNPQLERAQFMKNWQVVRLFVPLTLVLCRYSRFVN